MKFDASKKRNWLEDQCYKAHISVMAQHDLNWCMQCLGHLQLKYTVPIPEQEAADLLKILSARYRSWTGKGLKVQ